MCGPVVQSAQVLTSRIRHVTQQRQRARGDDAQWNRQQPNATGRAGAVVEPGKGNQRCCQGEDLGAPGYNRRPDKSESGQRARSPPAGIYECHR